MDIANITTLITALRNETEKQSVSPENVGYLLQVIVDFCNEQDLSLSEVVETLIDKFDSKVAILESKNADQDLDIIQIRSDVDSLSEDLVANKATLTKHEQSIAKNSEALANLNTLVEAAQGAAELAGADAAANKSQIGTLQASTETLASDMNQVQETMVNHGQSIAEMEVKNSEQDELLKERVAIDERLEGWHKAHSIINLHNFVSNMPTVETSVFPEYMVNVPSALLQNGLVVMINTLTGWEAWQLVDRENSLNHLGGYKQLAWDNAQELNAIAQLQAKAAERDERLSTLESFKSSQEVFNSATEIHISQTEEDYIGVNYADGNGPLFPRLIALEAKVKELLASLQ